MSSATLLRTRSAAEARLATIGRLLRNRDTIWEQISQHVALDMLIGHYAWGSVVALAAYGAVLGTASGHPLQVIVSALKLPLLLLLTLAVCLPTFYLYNLIYGGKLSLQQALALMLSAMTVTSSFNLAFAPVALFFRFAAWNYDFFVLVNYAILVLTSVVGFQVLIVGAKRINQLATRDQPAANGERTASSKRSARPQLLNMTLLYIWFGFSLFIGTQLYWALRPFFGNPNSDFLLFAPADQGNFYLGLLYRITQLLH